MRQDITYWRPEKPRSGRRTNPDDLQFRDTVTQSFDQAGRLGEMEYKGLP